MKYVLRKNPLRQSVVVKEFIPETEQFVDIAFFGSREEVILNLGPTFAGCVVEYTGVEHQYTEGFEVRFIGLQNSYLDTPVVPSLWQCDLFGNRFFEVARTKRDVLVAVASELKIVIALDRVRDGLWALNPFHMKWICSAAVLVKNGQIIDFAQSYGDTPEKLTINADGLSISRNPLKEEPQPFVFDYSP